MDNNYFLVTRVIEFYIKYKMYLSMFVFILINNYIISGNNNSVREPHP